MHVLQNTWSHGRMISDFLSKQMQHSIALGSSSGLTSATLVNRLGSWRACQMFRKYKRKIDSYGISSKMARCQPNTHFVMLLFTRWHRLQMRLESVEHLQEFPQINHLVVFNTIRFGITFDTGDSDCCFPQEWLVAAFFHRKNRYFPIWIEAFSWSIWKITKRNVMNSFTFSQIINTTIRIIYVVADNLQIIQFT